MLAQKFHILARALLVIQLCGSTSAANILGLLGMTSPSIQIWNGVLLHKLGELGHNITLLSVDLPNPSEKLPPNVHYIYLEEGYSVLHGQNTDLTTYFGSTPFETVKPSYIYGVDSLKGILASKGLQTLLNYPNDYKFDLIIHDYTVGPILLPFLDKFKYPPLIGLTTFHNAPTTMDAMFNHFFPAYIPHHATTYSTEMNFWERLHNTFLFIYETAYRRLIYLPQIDAMLRPYFGADMPYLGDLSGHTALSFINTHPAIDYAESLPPNIIEVGGMQIVDPKPLPDDLDSFMNKSRKGSVLISFGTNIHSKDFSDEKIDVILNAASQLPEYNFLWKFDPKYLRRTLPKNVLIQAFFPQRDILTHPKIKVFVTHCGAMSTQEATWRGVPMVGIPMFLDQHKNLRQSELAGVAVKLEFATMNTDSLRDAIKRVAEDPVMAQRIQERSVQFRDQPMKPLDKAVWWVEYLLRNPNPYHLKSPAAKLNIFQANSLDVLLFLWTVIMILLYCVIKLFLFVLKKLIGSRRYNSAPKKVKTK